jgi:hypothetical protein
LWVRELEEANDFGVGELMKVHVEFADSKEHRRPGEAHDVVYFIAQRFERVGRPDRNRENDLPWLLPPYSAQGRADRSAGRDAVVHYDYTAIL